MTGLLNEALAEVLEKCSPHAHVILTEAFALKNAEINSLSSQLSKAAQRIAELTRELKGRVPAERNEG